MNYKVNIVILSKLFLEGGAKMAHILIKTSGIKTELFIDGKKVNKVRKIAFEKKAGEAPVVCVDLLATDMEIDGELIPELPEIFKPFYTLKDPSEDV